MNNSKQNCDKLFLKQSLYLFGAFTFGSQFQRIIHELGHAVAAWIYGGKVVIDLHPFLISHCRSTPVPNPELKAWAGPIVAAAFGLILIAILWKLKARKPLWAPVWTIGFACLLFNGTYLAIGSIIRVGDAGYLINKLGTSSILIISVGLIMLSSGIVIFSINQEALFGISLKEPFGKRLAFLALGILPYRIFTLIYRIAADADGIADSTAYILAAIFFIVLTAIVPKLFPKVLSKSPPPRKGITWTNVAVSLVLAIIVIAALIVI